MHISAGAREGQWVLFPLELEWQAVVDHLIGTGDERGPRDSRAYTTTEHLSPAIITFEIQSSDFMGL